jgi:N-acetylneuraminic acid mutarotase
MSMERRGVASCVVNGKIYAIGGKHLDETFAAVEEYDPDEDRWIRKADMPTARAYLSASAVNGKIYAIGGGVARRGPYFSIVEEYDPITDKWTRKADMPTARAGLSTSVVDGRIYAIGGTHQCNGVNDFTALSTVEEYDPVTDRWARKADMPGPRVGVTAEVLDGKIYVIGGGHRLETFTTVEEYDPAEDTWAKKASMQVARAVLSASVVNGKIYAIGGVDFPMVYLSTVEEYTPQESEQQ